MKERSSVRRTNTSVDAAKRRFLMSNGICAFLSVVGFSLLVLMIVLLENMQFAQAQYANLFAAAAVQQKKVETLNVFVMGITKNQPVFVGGIALVFLLLIGAVIFIIIYNTRLRRLNQHSNELVKENYEVGKILVKRDIELTEANARLMALDASKSEFVSVAAHQLRTPITGIRWSFNALLDRELGEINTDQEKILQDGLKSSIRMINLINDLLNVARIEEGRFGLQFKKQPLGVIIQGVVDRHRTAIDEKGILFFLDMQAGLPSLDLDEEKMNIALDNMFDNAVKYTSPGGTITLKVAEEKGYIRVSVTDTGIGIPKNQIEKLFVKFFRADNALRFQTSGSGLGLYVVKNIVEAHGGTISVTSEENKGTTISFTIPIPSH